MLCTDVQPSVGIPCLLLLLSAKTHLSITKPVICVRHTLVETWREMIGRHSKMRRSHMSLLPFVPFKVNVNRIIAELFRVR